MSDKKPFFSIVMPIYNRASFLDISIGSVLTQKFENFELICVDDGSTDNSFEILNKYADKDSRIIVIHQSNKGRCLARNEGLEIAQADWICFLDSDDQYFPDHLNILKNLIQENPEFVGFSTNQLIGDHPKKYYHPKFNRKHAVLTLNDLIYSNPVQLNQFCYSRIHYPLLRFPNLDIPHSEDLLFIRQFVYKSSILWVNVITNRLTEHPERSVNMSNSFEFIKWHKFAANYFINNYNLDNGTKNKLESFTNLLCANVLLSDRKKKEGFRLLLKALPYSNSYTNILFYKGIIKLFI